MRARSIEDTRYHSFAIVGEFFCHEFQLTNEADASMNEDPEASDKLQQPTKLGPDGDYHRGQRERAEVILVGQLYPVGHDNVVIEWHSIHLFPEQRCVRRFDLNDTTTTTKFNSNFRINVKNGFNFFGIISIQFRVSGKFKRVNYVRQ